MHGYHPFSHWDGINITNTVIVAGATTQVSDSAKNRRTLILSLLSASSALPNPVRFGFGLPPSVASASVAFVELNSVVANITLSYRDWGETLNQPVWAFSANGQTVSVTEVMDSSPDCECYGR